MPFPHPSKIVRAASFCLLFGSISHGAVGLAQAADAPSYPQTLTGHALRMHVKQHPKINGKSNVSLGQFKTFAIDLKSNGWYDGISNNFQFSGKWKIEGGSQLCLTANGFTGTIDVSGCYVVQQTAERSFALISRRAYIAYGEPLSVFAVPHPGAAPVIPSAALEIVADPILIDITERDISPELFKSAASKALEGRGWKIAKVEARQIDATLAKGKEYRVRMLFRPDALIKIAFVPGYGMRSQSWLQNLRNDMEAAFAKSAM